MTRPGTSPNASISRSTTACSAGRMLCGSLPFLVEETLAPPPVTVVVPAHPVGARLGVAPIDGNLADNAVTGAVRGKGTERSVWSGSGRRRTDGMGTHIDRLMATGAPPPSAANLSWNERLNSVLSLAPISSDTFGAAAFRQTCGTLSTMGLSIESTAGGQGERGRGFGGRGSAVFPP